MKSGDPFLSLFFQTVHKLFNLIKLILFIHLNEFIYSFIHTLTHTRSLHFS